MPEKKNPKDAIEAGQDGDQSVGPCGLDRGGLHVRSMLKMEGHQGEALHYDWKYDFKT